ncbi:MAG: hypothetical protein RBS57_21525, partial [Desulforhabdus sp.]|nr:hypothetical protein [Desulforhabdus sp.]
MKRFRYSLLAAIFIFGLVLMPFAAYAQQQTDQPPAEPTPAHEMHGEHTQEETETDEQSAAKMMPYHQRMMERM